MKKTLDGFTHFLFYSPDDGGGIGEVAEIPHGEAGDLKILEDGSKDEEEAVVEDDADEDEDESGEPEVFEEPDKPTEEAKPAEKDEKEEEGEEDTFEGRPTLTDIKTKYPKIFKEFPELREVLFREHEFTKAFGTVEEAADASAKATSFDVLEAALLAGDSSPIIEQLSKTAPDALGKVVDNFLPTLLKSSQDLYLRATIPVIEQLLFMAHKHGTNSNDANLMRSAQHIANFMFGKPDIPDPSRKGQPAGPNPAEEQLNKEREDWNRTRFQEASQEVSEGIDAEMVKDITRGLDPEKKLTERQRSRLIDDIKEEIDAQLQKDPAFMRQMRSLWQRASTASYPKDQRASIKSAFLARAKALIPSVRSRLRSEWFGEQAASSDEKPTPKDKQQQPLVKKRTLPASGGASGSSGPKRPPSPKEVDYSKTSDLDLIEGRFTRKR